MAAPKAPKAKKADAPKVTEVPNFDLILGFKITRGGNFHGLWQLYKIKPSGIEKIGAETTRLSVINLARQEIGGTMI